MSKNKMTSKTDNKDENSLEESINIDPDTNTGKVNVDENGDEDISVEESVENKNKEIKELKDQLLRSLAEGENLRKRTLKEIADAKKYSHISFVRDLLSSVDNLQRALEAVPHTVLNRARGGELLLYPDSGASHAHLDHVFGCGPRAAGRLEIEAERVARREAGDGLADASEVAG